MLLIRSGIVTPYQQHSEEKKLCVSSEKHCVTSEKCSYVIDNLVEDVVNVRSIIDRVSIT